MALPHPPPTGRDEHASPPAAPGRSAAFLVRRLALAAFCLFVFTTLATPAWRQGPFAWGPLLTLPLLGGRPASLGWLSLLPAVIVAAWLGWHLLERPPRPFNWGWTGLTLPLGGLILLGLDAAVTWRTLVQGTGLLLFWLAYWFAVNERPNLSVALTLVVLAQGGVQGNWQKSDFVL